MAAVAVKEAIQRGEQLKKDGIVIRTYDLWKTYVMGDQEINAVSGVDIALLGFDEAITASPRVSAANRPSAGS